MLHVKMRRVLLVVLGVYLPTLANTQLLHKLVTLATQYPTAYFLEILTWSPAVSGID